MPCLEGMHTKDYLAQELRKVGLEEMAKKAETGYYHDYLSPIDFPEMQLNKDLNEAREKEHDFWKRVTISQMIARHIDGEFDANSKESDEWASSPDGQATFAMLEKGDKKGH